MLFLGSSILCATNIWVIISHRPITSTKFIDIPLGILGLTFFGIATVYVFVRFFDKRPALIIDNRGITDYSSLISAGFIPWENVANFGITRVYKQAIVTIMLRDPKAFLATQKPIKKAIMSINMKWYRSPVQLSANTLSVNANEILRLLQEHRAEWQSKNRQPQIINT